MEPIPQPKTVKVYYLIKQTGMTFTGVRNMANNSIGTGFFLSRDEAEHNRTLEMLADTTVGRKPFWHIFELDIPNPVYTE